MKTTKTHNNEDRVIWHKVMLPEVLNRDERMVAIAKWAIKNELPQDSVTIASRYVQFKRKQDVTFFNLSFVGALDGQSTQTLD